MTRRRYFAFFLILLSAAVAIGWQGKPISQLDPLVVSDITDDTLVLFGVAKTDVRLSYRLSLAELKKTMASARNIKQYGAIGNWNIETATGNDDTEAIQDAVDATPEGGTLYIPEGYFRCQGVNVTRPIRIEGPGVLVVGVNEFGYNLDLSSEWSGSNDITADADYTLTSALSTYTVHQLTTVDHGLKQGDIIKITSEFAYESVGDFYGEICKVIKVIDDDNFVIDRNFPNVDFATSEAHWRKLPVGRVDLDVNFDIVPGDVDTERVTEAPLVFLNGAIDPSIKVNAINSFGTVVHLCSVFKGSVEVQTGDIDGSSDLTGTDFGNNLSESAFAVRLNSCNGTTVKATSSGGQAGVYVTSPEDDDDDTYSTSLDFMQDMGANRNILVHDSISYGAYQCGFYAGLAFDCTFANCRAVYNSVLDTDTTLWPVGFYNKGGVNTLYDTCHVDAARRGWYFLSSANDAPLVMDGCSDINVKELVVYDNFSGSNLGGFSIKNHTSYSECEFIETTGGGSVVIDGLSLWHREDFNTPTFSISSGNSNLLLSDVIHQMASAGAGEWPTLFEVSADATEVNIIVNNYDVVFTNQSDRLDSVISSGAGAEVRFDLSGMTFHHLDFNGTSAFVFPSEHIIDDSNAGTITMVSDSVERGSRQEYGTAAPVAGTYVKGDIVWNSDPDGGEHIGWVCEASGSPGTWTTFGGID